MSKLKNKKIIICLIILIILIITLFSVSTVRIMSIRQNTKNSQEQLEEISYKFKKLVDDEKAQILVTFNYENGIKQIEYDNLKINANNKNSVSVDYVMFDNTSYSFDVTYSDNTKKTLTIDFKMPREPGMYALQNGIWSNIPDTSSFIKEKTRYLYMNSEGNLVPGNFLVGDEPENNSWYDYKNKKWPNVYIESEGVGSYYVWIPRYCYKLDQTTQRSDVKFISVDNNYKYLDSNGNKVTVTWDELSAEGYQIPEAFLFDNMRLAGYWMNKYQLSDLSSYIVDFSVPSSSQYINVKNITATDPSIVKYTYAVNGTIIHESATPDDYRIENANANEGSNIINVTALNANGEIVGSMTKEAEQVKVNAPDISSFDKYTTFYVYWDENGIEHNEVPISMDAPSQWYDYTSSNWANIVTRANGEETYYVWIPRYCYKLNQVSQRSDVRFLEGTSSDVPEGYKIPEAFTFGEKPLTGYWMTKYQLSDVSNTTRITADVTTTNSKIHVKNIRGSLVTNATTNNVTLKYEYYIDGRKMTEGTDAINGYTYTGLDQGHMYGINIIARNSNTNEFVGAITKKVITTKINPPDVSSFDPETTYYVTYDDSGNEARTKLSDGEPSNWYDYSNKKWANIVTTANNTETYFVWIPRYSYKLNSSLQRSDIEFLEGTSTSVTPGYKIPEAFTFGEKPLTGYWMTKYQLK